jgi:type III secretion system YopN/LcrE/InvE/MxiC family regulator
METPSPLAHVSPVAPHRTYGQSSSPAKAEGKWHGQSVRWVRADPAAAPAVGHLLGSARTREQEKLLSQRTVTRGVSPPPMQIAQIVRAVRLSDGGGSVQHLAARLIRGGALPPAVPQLGRRGVVRNFLALKAAEKFLDEDADEDDVLALLTPVKGSAGSARELAEMLQDAGDDPEALARLLKDVEGLPKDPRALYDALRHIRHHPRQLAAYLRDAQKLPFGRSALQRLRQQIQDALREMERTDGGLIHASLNAAEVAATAIQPQEFLDGYVEVVHGNLSFCDALKNLVERFGAQMLRKTLDTMKKALGDDLRAATPSCDKDRLRVILNDLSNMHTSTTFLEELDALADRQHRMASASIIGHDIAAAA